MKNILIIVCIALFSSYAFSQRTLEWSIGDVEIVCDETVKLSYPLLVSINNDGDNPALATSTFRLFYDANKLENFDIQNIRNGYSKSGLMQSIPFLGNDFGFSSQEGVFMQFDIIDNAVIDPIHISTSPTHVLDFVLEVKSDAKYPVCVSIILDNNHEGAGEGANNDSGYLLNEAGIVGNYFLGNDFENSISADDEVVHKSWDPLNNFTGKIRFKGNGKKAGRTNKKDCIKYNECRGPDCDDDGIPDSQEVDTNRDGTPDDCENGSLNLVGNYNWHALFKAYPIPFDQELFIYYNFDYNTDVTIEIFDAKNTLVRKIENKKYYSGQAYQQRIDLSNIAHQMLFVKLTTNKNTSSKKIMSTLNQ